MTNTDPSVRKSITMPASFAARLDALKVKRGGNKTDSEVLREGIRLLEACSDPNVTIILRNEDGKETELKVV